MGVYIWAATLIVVAVWGNPTAAQVSPGKIIETIGDAGEKIIKAATAAFGGVNIDGDVKVDVETGEVIAVAKDGSEALIGVCSVSGANVNGDYECTAKTGDIKAIAGANSKTRISIGTTGYK